MGDCEDQAKNSVEFSVANGANGLEPARLEAKVKQKVGIFRWDLRNRQSLDQVSSSVAMSLS